MLNYVQAELYKLSRRKYLYITLAVLLAGIALIVWGWVFTNARGNDVTFFFGGGMLVTLFGTGFYATILSVDMVFSEQYKFNTLKNEVSFGLSRERIYFGKLLVQILVSLLICAVVVVGYEGLCWLGLLHDGMDMEALGMVGYCLLGALPLWLGAQAFANAVFFNVKGEILASSIVVLTFSMAHNLIRLLAFLFTDKLMPIYNYMPSVMVDSLYSRAGQWDYIATCWLVGAVWFVVSMLLGLRAFQRREIV